MAFSHALYPSLRNKVVVVTGGAEGIGAATVELFCRQGCRVVIIDNNIESASKLANDINNLDPIDGGFPKITVPSIYRCDVTDLERLREVADLIGSKIGAVDVLVNNAAATGTGSRVSSAQVTPESWDESIKVNLRHMFFLTKYFVPGMMTKGSGSIINMGSISWRIPATDTPVYVACKAAVMGMTRAHAKEYGQHGIRVNSVMPGAIATARQVREVLTPEYRRRVFEEQSLKRDLSPMEVAKVIVFLGSDEASAVTGGSHVVDGGWVGDT